MRGRRDYEKKKRKKEKEEVKDEMSFPSHTLHVSDSEEFSKTAFHRPVI